LEVVAGNGKALGIGLARAAHEAHSRALGDTKIKLSIIR
jgi:hypothetical protein